MNAVGSRSMLIAPERDSPASRLGEPDDERRVVAFQHAVVPLCLVVRIHRLHRRLGRVVGFDAWALRKHDAEPLLRVVVKHDLGQLDAVLPGVAIGISPPDARDLEVELCAHRRRRRRRWQERQERGELLARRVRRGRVRQGRRAQSSVAGHSLHGCREAGLRAKHLEFSLGCVEGAAPDAKQPADGVALQGVLIGKQLVRRDVHGLRQLQAQDGVAVADEGRVSPHGAARQEAVDEIIRELMLVEAVVAEVRRLRRCGPADDRAIRPVKDHLRQLDGVQRRGGGGGGRRHSRSRRGRRRGWKDCRHDAVARESVRGRNDVDRVAHLDEGVVLVTKTKGPSRRVALVGARPCEQLVGADGGDIRQHKLQCGDAAARVAVHNAAVHPRRGELVVDEVWVRDLQVVERYEARVKHLFDADGQATRRVEAHRRK
eukprot:scaffold16183_cov89-Phaeocystis_antarctica.AAC.4